MRTSQQVLEWQNEGQARGELKNLRAVILRCLEQRCNAPVPRDLNDTIQSANDMNLLLRWFDTAVKANSYDEFRAAMQS